MSSRVNFDRSHIDISSPGNRKPINIVLCLDGTQNEFGPRPSTNTLKLFLMLDKNPLKQLCYYQPGIGTFSAEIGLNTSNMLSRSKQVFSRQLDSVFASTFPLHVKAAYSFLMHCYQTEDRVYLIGFRGSFTARVLVGMLETIGLLTSGLEDMVPTAWDIYSSWENEGRSSSNVYMSQMITQFKKTFCRSDVKVNFMGLFDTVNSIGFLRDRMFPFTTSSAAANHIRHAISLDERRAKFKPVLFEQNTLFPQSPQHCDQMSATPSGLFRWARNMLSWIFRRSFTRPKDECNCLDIVEKVFSGNHGDVGGGWGDDANQRLSDLPLRWIIREAEKNGILFNKESLADFDANSSVVTSLLAYNHDLLKYRDLPANPSKSLPDQPIQGNNGSAGNLVATIFWWIVELIPIGIKLQDENGQWRNSYIPNFGRPRKLPENLQYHWSVFYRLHFFEDYCPLNLPENIGQALQQLLVEFKQQFNWDQIQAYCKTASANLIKKNWQDSFWLTIPDETIYNQ